MGTDPVDCLWTVILWDPDGQAGAVDRDEWSATGDLGVLHKYRGVMARYVCC